MLESARVIPFVPSTDLERSRQFYEAVLGLSVAETSPYAFALRTGGTTLRLTKVDELRPQPFTVLGWAVPAIHEAVAELAGRGVEFTRYDGMGQDPDGVWTAPGGAMVAWFSDPDGNTLSLTQFPD